MILHVLLLQRWCWICIITILITRMLQDALAQATERARIASCIAIPRRLPTTQWVLSRNPNRTKKWLNQEGRPQMMMARIMGLQGPCKVPARELRSLRYCTRDGERLQGQCVPGGAPKQRG